MEKEDGGVFSVGQMEKLEAEIRAGLAKVRRLEELSPEDRKGKYRKAIEELMTKVKRLCSEYLTQVCFGCFIAPVKDHWFEQQLLEWFQSEDYTEQKARLVKAVQDGDADVFFAVADSMHNVTWQIVEAFGGKEDRPT